MTIVAQVLVMALAASFPSTHKSRFRWHLREIRGQKNKTDRPGSRGLEREISATAESGKTEIQTVGFKGAKRITKHSLTHQRYAKNDHSLTPLKAHVYPALPSSQLIYP